MKEIEACKTINQQNEKQSDKTRIFSSYHVLSNQKPYDLTLCVIMDYIIYIINSYVTFYIC